MIAVMNTDVAKPEPLTEVGPVGPSSTRTRIAPTTRASVAAPAADLGGTRAHDGSASTPRVDLPPLPTPAEILDPERCRRDEDEVIRLSNEIWAANEAKHKAGEAERADVAAKGPVPAPAPAETSPWANLSEPVELTPSTVAAIRRSTSASALTTADMRPGFSRDVLVGDAGAHRKARTEQQLAVGLAFALETRPLITEVSTAHAGEHEPRQFAEAANAIATGTKSPLAAGVLLTQVLHVVMAIRGRVPQPGAEMNATIREVRMLVAELQPRDAIDGHLAALLVMVQQAVGAVLFRLTVSSDPVRIAVLAAAVEKLTRVTIAAERAYERRRHPRRRAGNRIVIRDQAQAIVGDVHLAPQS